MFSTANVCRFLETHKQNQQKLTTFSNSEDLFAFLAMQKKFCAYKKNILLLPIHSLVIISNFACLQEVFRENLS